MLTFTTRIVAIKTIATDTIEVSFEKPTDFSFTPGQFVQWLIPYNEKQTPRSYSIASINEDEHLVFAVKLLEGGRASEWLRAARIGDTLEMRGPLGHFINKHVEHQSALFVATGTGLAPIISMIKDELETKQNPKPLTLLFGVRHESDVFWDDVLQKLQADYPHFQYHICLSQPTSDSWAGLHGRVTAHIASQTVHDQYFLCGSAPMVKEVRTQLLEQGVVAPAIHFEIF